MIEYDFYQSPKLSEAEETKYHIRPVGRSVITSENIADRMQRQCTISKPDVVLALSALSRALVEVLNFGHTVRLDGIGSFRVVLEGSVEKRGRGLKLVNGGVRNICFRPDPKLLNAVRQTKLERSVTRGNHSKTYTKEELMALLDHYFQEHETLTPRDFCDTACMAKATGTRTLKTLREAGVIKNIGTARLHLYVKGNK
ncbi:MAG: hypothetical protein RR386_09525 [Bacteroidaceae bacterium]